MRLYAVQLLVDLLDEMDLLDSPVLVGYNWAVFVKTAGWSRASHFGALGKGVDL